MYTQLIKMQRLQLSATLVVLLAAFSCVAAINPTISWTGANSNSWHEAQNWNPERLPTAEDTVLVNNCTIDGVVDGSCPVVTNEVLVGNITVTSSAVVYLESGKLEAAYNFVADAIEIVAGGDNTARKIVFSGVDGAESRIDFLVAAGGSIQNSGSIGNFNLQGKYFTFSSDEARGPAEINIRGVESVMNCGATTYCTITVEKATSVFVRENAIVDFTMAEFNFLHQTATANFDASARLNVVENGSLRFNSDPRDPSNVIISSDLVVAEGGKVGVNDIALTFTQSANVHLRNNSAFETLSSADTLPVTTFNGAKMLIEHEVEISVESILQIIGKAAVVNNAPETTVVRVSNGQLMLAMEDQSANTKFPHVALSEGGQLFVANGVFLSEMTVGDGATVIDIGSSSTSSNGGVTHVDKVTVLPGGKLSFDGSLEVDVSLSWQGGVISSESCMTKHCEVRINTGATMTVEVQTNKSASLGGNTVLSIQGVLDFQAGQVAVAATNLTKTVEIAAGGKLLLDQNAPIATGLVTPISVGAAELPTLVNNGEVSLVNGELHLKHVIIINNGDISLSRTAGLEVSLPPAVDCVQSSTLTLDAIPYDFTSSGWLFGPNAVTTFIIRAHDKYPVLSLPDKTPFTGGMKLKFDYPPNSGTVLKGIVNHASWDTITLSTEDLEEELKIIKSGEPDNSEAPLDVKIVLVNPPSVSGTGSATGSPSASGSTGTTPGTATPDVRPECDHLGGRPDTYKVNNSYLVGFEGMELKFASKYSDYPTIRLNIQKDITSLTGIRMEQVYVSYIQNNDFDPKNVHTDVRIVFLPAREDNTGEECSHIYYWNLWKYIIKNDRASLEKTRVMKFMDVNTNEAKETYATPCKSAKTKFVLPGEKCEDKKGGDGNDLTGILLIVVGVLALIIVVLAARVFLQKRKAAHEGVLPYSAMVTSVGDNDLEDSLLPNDESSATPYSQMTN